jgi:hypothetical protein
MNNTYLILAAVIYLVSCIPMFVANTLLNTEQHKDTKIALLIADGVATVVAYIFLWKGFDNNLASLAACVIAFTINSSIGAVLRSRGYDPYGTEARKAAKAAA